MADWLRAAQACSADKAISAVIKSKAREKLSALRLAADWQEMGPSSSPDESPTSEGKPALRKEMDKVLGKEYPHLRLAAG